ncbi:MAG: NAD-dependent epimerase/dehydratase family protein [Bacteroidia bacterium]
MRVLITGGAGFIGSHLAEALYPYHEVHVLDNLSTGQRENLPPDIPLYEIDLREANALEAHFAKHTYEVICHLAAQVDVRSSIEAPQQDAQVNILGTLLLLQAVRNFRPWVIFASTGGAIYGEKVRLPIPESEPPNPESPYGISKLAGELYLQYFGRVYGFPYTILRLANVYGPRQSPHGEAGVVAIFSYRLLTGQPTWIYGDGYQTRDFIFVADVVNAFLSVLQHPTTTQNQIFNVGTAQATAVIALHQRVAAQVGSSQRPQFLPPKPGEIRHNSLDATKLYRATGWQPRTTLEEGLAATLAALQTAATPTKFQTKS